MAKAAQETPEININLLPTGAPSGTVGTAIGWVLTTGRYLIILTEIIAISIFVLNIFLITQKQSLKEDVQRLSADVVRQEDFEKEFRFTQRRINEVAAVKGAVLPENFVLDEFLKLLPQGVVLDSLEIGEGEISFSGSFPTPKELQTLVSSFSQSEKIVGLDIKELNSPSEKNPLYTFKASASIVEAKFK